MLFQTFPFLIFFFATCALTFVLRGRAQRALLLAASLFFYAYGSLAHLWLLVLVILLTYGAALLLEKKRSRALFALALVLSFLPLFVCKYVPFFAAEFFPQTAPQLRRVIGLPIGISFFTFQAVSYVIDVWRGRMPAQRDLLLYALFVSFFPQLVAGPIERAQSLMTQLGEERRFDRANAAAGFTRMGLGLFLKIFVADRLAYLVDLAYQNVANSTGFTLLVGTMLFGFQIYCDFFGYSTIARGSAQVLGVELCENFRRPYLAQSCTEFWRRWHISLSTWFRDYVYIPLGGSRCGPLRNSLNLLLTFALSGLWHGANWTFLVWGTLNGAYQVVERRLGLTRPAASGTGRFFRRLGTYLLITLSWVFFRAKNMDIACTALWKILCVPADLYRVAVGALPTSALMSAGGLYLWNLALALAGVAAVAIHSFRAERGHDLMKELGGLHPALRRGLYVLLLFVTLCFGKLAQGGSFIYFRF